MKEWGQDMTHVDDWIDEPVWGENTRALRYAKWFLLGKRRPAWMQSAFKEFEGAGKLFCAYEGKRYRVTGASRLGDVWLAADHNREVGYDLRVAVDHCSDWGDAP